MATSLSLPNNTGPVLKSHFLGRSTLFSHPHNLSFTAKLTPKSLKPCAKFNLFELLGGRGLCNGEKGLEEELKRNVDEQAPQDAREQDKPEVPESLSSGNAPGDGFEKELMGMTGGFPGGEKGLQKFIEENPPPVIDSGNGVAVPPSNKPKPPELPLLLPGMIAIVKNPNNPFYMYCGIVQRITDGKAGVLFEGGNWDKLITFRLDELERREKGPPGRNPKSTVIETVIQPDFK